jgi:hypothetical protein
MFPHPDPSQFGNPDLLSLQPEFVVGDVKTVIHPPFLESRVFAGAVEKIDKGSSQVAEGLTVRISQHFRNPGELFVFDSVEFFLQCQSGRLQTFLKLTIPFFQRPVIRKAGNAAGLSEIALLDIIGIEFDFMG